MPEPKAETDTIQKIGPVLAQIDGLSSKAREFLATSKRSKIIPNEVLRILEQLAKVGQEPPPPYIQRQFELAGGPWEACPECGHPTYNPETKVCEVCNAESYPYGKGPFPGGEFKRRWDAQPDVPIHAPTGDPVGDARAKPTSETPIHTPTGDPAGEAPAKECPTCGGDSYLQPCPDCGRDAWPRPPAGINLHAHTYIPVPNCPQCGMPLKVYQWVCPRAKAGCDPTIHTPTTDPVRLVDCPDCGHPMQAGQECPARTYTHNCPPKRKGFTF